MAQLSRSERIAILDASLDAEERGDREEAERLAKKLPLPLHLAEFMKEEFGAQYLVDGGWNLSEVEAQCGKDWINK